MFFDIEIGGKSHDCKSRAMVPSEISRKTGAQTLILEIRGKRLVGVAAKAIPTSCVAEGALLACIRDVGVLRSSCFHAGEVSFWDLEM